ncbi:MULTISPECIES: U32 family peptidase [Aphanizomenon]|uniref:U32 family peptidase n=3 Tax=Aphanizomenon flos-aquae TaxID=1176 RepID=A0ABR8IUT5_APHFL|nr:MULTISPECIES: U32 family peptidase [Aphanizomenon]MBD2391673.1 U32 family peptidase [Aphanizomenon flos-aquae FACHB-1171]MBD2556101.1 U32 family peptidase [Aphanizomenon flos-aquae FACHB-1290]MBD2632975.1 U32 family peptidase [Aphanizomenon sp. FACHB-1399]MBD2643781.1 U32 family peptidase [Aphanizomenon sp. FACHB-1401]MBD2658149.1 U32 family peptidase [Aphanizomenon flos-aquae FACHB-1265]
MTSISTSTLEIPELLAPAGNWECAKAAIENGADAIYFGLEKFNARMRAENFTLADLPELMEFLHLRGVKGYITLNTLIFAQELTEVQQYLKTIISAGVDAVIVQDVGICRLIRHLSPDFPIHASTQMTITSAAGVEFAKSLGCQLVVLARECSILEINKIQKQILSKNISLPLEIFVHGALCVAYSGQCLTSEALGGRSANRGECAQACRMPYDLIANGEVVNLGNRKYLLSPQDLAGLEVLPELVKSGVTSLKIEGRLKAPEYVANVTRVYRQALNQIIKTHIETFSHTEKDQYNLEMAFSRGLYTGWFEGINNQELVHGRFGKKRGVYLGEVTRIKNAEITVKLEEPVKAGDGIVFDCGHPERKEEGGRIYAVIPNGKETILTFGRNDLNFHSIHIGDKVWKTNDPELDKQIRQSYTGENPQFTRPINIEVYGEIGEKLIAVCRDELGNIVQVESEIFIAEAHTRPLSIERLKEQFGRLGNTPFYLDTFINHLNGNIMLPVSELNRMRREIVSKLEDLRSKPKLWQLNHHAKWQDLITNKYTAILSSPSLIVLVRNIEQLKAVLTTDIKIIYCEFEDPRNYKEAVKIVRESAEEITIFVAPPRITKPGETWILKQVHASQADGYLIRNYDQLEYFANEKCVGDFSLNIANPLTADYFKNRFNLERLTVSYDLNINQLEDLITNYPAQNFEVTIHQHIPMFHMEHCVFCAFLSTGTDYTNCGRPCDTQAVTIRDRVGSEHILKADAGCRNTVYNSTAQTGAEYVQRLIGLGLQHLRIEFVNETREQVQKTIQSYQKLLKGEIIGSQLWRELKLQNQLGVTRGALRIM